MKTKKTGNALTRIICLKFTLTVSLITVIAFVTGCNILDEIKKRKRSNEDRPEYVLSVHEIVKFPRAKMLEKEITTFSGDKVWINKNPFLHARDITKVELVRRRDQRISEDQKLYGKIPSERKSKDDIDDKTPKFYDLKLFLTRRGKLAWMQISVGFRHKKLALVIDGIYYRGFYPGKVTHEEEEFAILEGPIDETCAKAIEEKAEFNYDHFRKDQNFDFKKLWK